MLKKYIKRFVKDLKDSWRHADIKIKLYTVSFPNDSQCLKINQNVAFEFSSLTIFNELLFTQNVNLACYARNVE